MATSGVTEWSVTARDFVAQALRENFVLSSGEEPTAEELEDCIFRFNAMLKSWAASTPNLWRETSGTLTVTANTSTVVVDAAIQQITSARIVESSAYHRQLTPWGRDHYFSLPNKAATGNPSIYYFSKGVGAPTLYVWPVPSTSKTIAIDYLRVPETITDASQTVDFPEEYTEVLMVNLARRCWGVFRDSDPRSELVERAARLERELMDASRPDSYFMQSACA